MHTKFKGVRRTTPTSKVALVLLFFVYAISRTQQPNKRTASQSLLRPSEKRLVVVLQSKAEWFKGIFGVLLGEAFPNVEIVYRLSDDVGEERYDLVIESVPTFGADSKHPCTAVTGPWIQVTGEALVHYNNSAWCRHDQDPLVRLDTSLKPLHQGLVKNTTHFLWSPYVCNFKLGHLADYSKGATLDVNRPFSLAWISSNCVHFRISLWQALKRMAVRAGLDGFHSLGKCEHDHDIDSSSWWSNYEVYKDYKFVLVMENVIEPGYVTEKLATAIASGAIPIYYGDDAAASLIFEKASFISITKLSKQVSRERSPDEVWDEVAQMIVDIILDRDKLEEYFSSDKVTQPEAFSFDVFPSSCAKKGKMSLQLSSGHNDVRAAVALLQNSIQLR